jgi:hypothetical protein
MEAVKRKRLAERRLRYVWLGVPVCSQASTDVAQEGTAHDTTRQRATAHHAHAHLLLSSCWRACRQLEEAMADRKRKEEMELAAITRKRPSDGDQASTWFPHPF